MTYTIAKTDRIAVVHARLARMDALTAALNDKRLAILNAKRMTGKDAARYVTLVNAMARLDALHPLHRVRYLPG